MAITLIVILMLSIGYVFKPGKNILWFVVGVVALTILFIHFVNRKIAQIKVPTWYKYLNLAVWCALILVLGFYFS